MDDEPELAEVSEDDGRPATKADLNALERRVASTVATKQELAEFKDEIIRHFDVVAENIHRDVAGANADEISLIQDRQADFKKRLEALERA
jgi:hypothetical protein